MDDLTGKKFGRFIVVSFSHFDKNHFSVFWCECECGTLKQVRGHNLKDGSTVSCGCYSKEATSTRFKGEKHHFWNPDLTDEDRQIGRNYNEYYEWRRKIYERDNYECQICGSNDNLQAHHLNAFAKYKDQRTDPSNGVLLCRSHHLDYHSRYGRGNNTKEEFQEYLKSLNLT